MKAIVTGHKRGVGLWITEFLSSIGYEVAGFSISDEKNISMPEVQLEVINSCRDADLFINNAHDGFSQVQLLSKVFQVWKSQNKHIINIGAGHFKAEIWQLVEAQYLAEKAALHAHTQFLQTIGSQCRISLLALGTMDTVNCSPLPPPKISQIQLAYCLNFLISSPEGLNIEHLEINTHPSS